jgi:SAM-dependent methyltransferase
MYEYIRDSVIDVVKAHPQYPKFIWKPKIIDIGCGSGIGTNILSQEADFAWGIDIAEPSVRFAQEMFTRHKNNIYYGPQLTFDVVDIKTDTREIMAFDIVVCIEVIEHIADYNLVLNFIKKLCKKDKSGNYLEPPNSTICYISSPNRNQLVSNGKSQKRPANRRHVREWSPQEMYALLTKHFKYVLFRDQDGRPQELNTLEPHMLFQCEVPLL